MATKAFMIQGVCKDCGNGTLNNDLVPAFELGEDFDYFPIIVCKRCGSQHVDVVVL